MKANFLTRERGPKNRKQEPLTFDNNCNEDPWVIKVILMIYFVIRMYYLSSITLS
ncbi:hypothetical protein ANCCAN_03184 [Ancylostoma caninum]|uniref:Uncharacterized protein n=1 Tax=Ancylostoma caninum TaxID=29170 RepID=A0A368H1T6_ANCCA|nr:hypothetical protein ANCCAN_03184 [Ancylostoma caninum]